MFYGFNQDETNRKVFDGVLAHVAGAGRGSFNHRFAQPSRDGHPFLNKLYPSDIFPFTDVAQSDPEVELSGACSPASTRPTCRRCSTPTQSYEYWGRAASLIHTTIDGSTDAEVMDNVRISRSPAVSTAPDAFRRFRRAVSSLAIRTTIPGSCAVCCWRWTGGSPMARAPGQPLPTYRRERARAARRPRVPRTSGCGPASRAAQSVSCLLRSGLPGEGHRHRGTARGHSAVHDLGAAGGRRRKRGRRNHDAGGGSAAGHLHRLESVPVEGGSDRRAVQYAGFYIVFPRTRADRGRTGDSRKSIEERYASRAAYLGLVSEAALALVDDGYLLAEDIAPVLERAGLHWDHVMGSVAAGGRP